MFGKISVHAWSLRRFDRRFKNFFLYRILVHWEINSIWHAKRCLNEFAPNETDMESSLVKPPYRLQAWCPKSSHRTRSKEFHAKQPTPDQHTVGLKDINSDILELKSLILHQLVHLLPVRKTRWRECTHISGYLQWNANRRKYLIKDLPGCWLTMRK